MNGKNGIEDAKLNLLTTEEMADALSNPITKGIRSTIADLIPFFGTMLDEGIDSLIEEKIERNRSIFIDELLKSKDRISKEMINNVDFLLSLMKSIDAVTRISNDEKVIFYAKLMKHSFLSNEVEEIDQYESWLEKLLDLTVLELYMLRTLYKYEQEYGRTQNKDEYQAWARFLQDVHEEQNLNYEMIDAIMMGIARTGFCREAINFGGRLVLGGVDLESVGKPFFTTPYYEQFHSRLYAENE